MPARKPYFFNKFVGTIIEYIKQHESIDNDYLVDIIEREWIIKDIVSSIEVVNICYTYENYISEMTHTCIHRLLYVLFIIETIFNVSMCEWLDSTVYNCSMVKYRVMYFNWKMQNFSIEEASVEAHMSTSMTIITRYGNRQYIIRYCNGSRDYCGLYLGSTYTCHSKSTPCLIIMTSMKNTPKLAPPPLSPNIPPVKNNITKKQRISPTIDNIFRYQKQVNTHIEPPPKQIEPDTTIYPIIEVTLTEEMRDSLCVVNMQPIVDYYNKLIEVDRTWLHWCSCTQRKLTAKIREEINKQNMVPPWWQSNFGQFELDHIIRIEAGGLTAPENLVIMLPELNRSENGCDATNQTKRSLIGEKNLCKATEYCNNISNAYIKILEKT